MRVNTMLSGGPGPVRRRMLEPLALPERQTRRRRSQLPVERPAWWRITDPRLDSIRLRQLDRLSG